MGRRQYHRRTPSASTTSSTDSDPLHRPLLQEASSEDDISLLLSIYSRTSTDSYSSRSSLTGGARIRSDIRSFITYLSSSLTMEKYKFKSGFFTSEKHAYARRRARKWLGSKAQHYLLMGLIALDVLSIFADIFISLYTCEEGHDRSPTTDSRLDETQDALAIVSLVFSCIFLVELMITIWAFGLRWFRSRFHCFDAVVIVASFVMDVVLHGINKEVASLVVLLRLFRFVKIIEEISDTQEERVEEFEERIRRLEDENRRLKGELDGKGGGGGDRDGDLEAQRGGERKSNNK